MSKHLVNDVIQALYKVFNFFFHQRTLSFLSNILILSLLQVILCISFLKILESTDTASEMLYDSFDHEFLSSESFDMEENCFLDDLTEEDITACISNDEVLLLCFYGHYQIQ